MESISALLTLTSPADESYTAHGPELPTRHSQRCIPWKSLTVIVLQGSGHLASRRRKTTFVVITRLLEVSITMVTLLTTLSTTSPDRRAVRVQP